VPVRVRRCAGGADRCAVVLPRDGRDAGRAAVTRPQYALATVRAGNVQRQPLQPAHISSRCRGGCHLDGAPCRDVQQAPPLTAAARDVLLQVRDGATAPSVESLEWRMRRWRERGWL
jgi:hypothetical protein